MMEINFCKPDSSDIKSLKKLWLSSFDEEPKAVDLFFAESSRAYLINLLIMPCLRKSLWVDAPQR